MKITGTKKTVGVLISLAALSAVFSGCGGPRREEWGVLVYGLPQKLSVGNASETTSYYILKQTHEPILRTDDGRTYYSRILKSWERNLASSEFLFCPDAAQKFNAGEKFTPERLFSHLKAITAKFDPEARVDGVNGCVRVDFPRRRKDYLEYLSAYENAPTVNRTPEIEDGLGKFYAESVSNEKIVLKRKEAAGGGYAKVAFYEFKGKDDANLQNRSIRDFNLIPGYDVPDWAKRTQNEFNTVELKSVVLIINHSDPLVRKAVYNCIDPAVLRTALFPQKKDFYDIKTILPIGMPGALGGIPERHCERFHNKVNEELTFANWTAEAGPALQRFADSVRAESGLRIHIVAHNPGELAKKLHTSPHPYNMVVVVLDAIRPNCAAFYPRFVSRNGYYDFPRKDLEYKYKKLMEEQNESKQIAEAAALAGQFAKQAIALPLYQNVKRLYYPKEIRNLNVGKGFLQYPEVAALEI